MSENEALQVTGPQAVKVGEGLNDIFLRPTPMEMVQRTSQKVTDPAAYGKLRDTLTGALHTSVGAIPLRISSSRVYFQPGADFGSDPLCKSDDGVVPSPFALVKQADDCKSCERSQWVNGAKPPCQDQKRLLFLMEETSLPYVITVKGASIKPMRMVMEGIYRDILAAKARGVYRQLYDYRLDLKPTMVQGRQGTYFILNLLNVKPIEDPGKYGPMFEQFTKAARRAQQTDNQLQAAQSAELEDDPVEP